MGALHPAQAPPAMPADALCYNTITGRLPAMPIPSHPACEFQSAPEQSLVAESPQSLMDLADSMPAARNHGLGPGRTQPTVHELRRGGATRYSSALQITSKATTDALSNCKAAM